MKSKEIIEGIDCSWFKDCVYYKQLELLKKKYTNVLNLAKQNADSNEYCLQELEEQFNRLKKENEELKNRLKTLDDEEFVYEVTEIEYNNFKKMNEYKQALEEIKNFSENFCSNNCPYYTDKESNVCNDGCLLDDIVNPIIKKINEVLNEK